MKPFSTFRAFNLCFLLAFGLAFRPIAARSQTPIACGQSIASNTVVNTEIDQYTYAGTSGQVVSVAFFWGTAYDNEYGEADIYSPNGQLLTSLVVASGGTAANLTLTNSGTYTILVHEDGYNLTAGYQLSIQSPKGGGCNPRPITCGENLTSNTTFATEMDSYSYVGTSGQVVSVAFFWGTAYDNEYGEADIYSPNGQLLTSLVVASGGTAANLALTTNGTYTILVHEDGYNLIASYELGIQSKIDGGCNDLENITCGQSISGTISQPVEVDAYQIDGCSNDVIIISTSGFSGSEFDLYDPNGNKLFSIGPGTASNVTFSVSGVYTLLVHSSSYNSTGSYGATLTCLSACTYTTTTTSSPPNGGSTTGGGAIRCCFPVTLCATPTPNTCYNFVSWTLNSNVVSTSECYTFFATNSETLTANFALTRGVTNQICGVQVAGTNVAISAQSVEGDNYQLQSRNSMTTGSWSNVTGAVLSNSAGGYISLTNFGGASTTQKFYRLFITP